MIEGDRHRVTVTVKRAQPPQCGNKECHRRCGLGDFYSVNRLFSDGSAPSATCHKYNPLARNFFIIGTHSPQFFTFDKLHVPTDTSSAAMTSSSTPAQTDPEHQLDPPQERKILLFFSPEISSYFIAGGVAGAASRTVVSPLERLKIIQSVLDHSFLYRFVGADVFFCASKTSAATQL